MLVVGPIFEVVMLAVFNFCGVDLLGFSWFCFKKIGFGKCHVPTKCFSSPCGKSLMEVHQKWNWRKIFLVIVNGTLQLALAP